MNNTKEILSWLEDEESKFIYEKRVEYNETHDFSLIQAIVDKYLPQLKDKKYYPGIELEMVKKLKDKKRIIIFGAGLNGETVLGILNKANITADCIIDNNESKWLDKIGGVVIKNPEIIDYSDIDAIIVTPYSIDWIEMIHKQLTGYGVNESIIIDYRDYCPYMLEDEQYFDENIIKLRDEEVFVDGGVLDLGTSMQFIDFCKKGGVSKYSIHAFEPDYKSFVRCQNILENNTEDNIKLYNAGLWSNNTTLYFDEQGNGGSKIVEDITKKSIDVVALDNCISDKVTFIKMNIEGAELDALKGASNIIKSQKPKLAICVYHKKEDLIEIPMFIKSLVPEYKLYIRHYSNDAGETVLYAI